MTSSRRSFLVSALAAATLALSACATSAPVSDKVTQYYEQNKELQAGAPRSSAPALPKLSFAKGDPVLFFGDSWTFGMSAEPATKGFAYETAAALGLKADVQGGIGTGYVNPGTSRQGTFSDRLSALPPSSPKLVVIQGSVNDFGQYIPAVNKAASDFVAAVTVKYPGAQVVMMGPATFTWPADPQVAQVDKILAGVAADKGVYYVSPSSDGWITADNFPKVIDPATSHPSTEGHAYLGGKLVEALNKLKG